MVSMPDKRKDYKHEAYSKYWTKAWTEIIVVLLLAVRSGSLLIVLYIWHPWLRCY